MCVMNCFPGRCRRGKSGCWSFSCSRNEKTLFGPQRVPIPTSRTSRRSISTQDPANRVLTKSNRDNAGDSRSAKHFFPFSPLRSLNSLFGLFIRQQRTMQCFRRSALGALRSVSHVQQRGYAKAATGYASTADNLRINGDTKVIYQGFTGKQGT